MRPLSFPPFRSSPLYTLFFLLFLSNLLQKAAISNSAFTRYCNQNTATFMSPECLQDKISFEFQPPLSMYSQSFYTNCLFSESSQTITLHHPLLLFLTISSPFQSPSAMQQLYIGNKWSETSVSCGSHYIQTPKGIQTRTPSPLSAVTSGQVENALQAQRWKTSCSGLSSTNRVAEMLQKPHSGKNQ